MPVFDLNILPIYRINGQELASMPGLLAVTAPRRCARGREHDQLIMYLTPSGNAPMAPEELRQLMDAAAGLFYQSPGSLTSAMRRTAESINSALVQRNSSSTRNGQYALGLLAIAVVRESQCTFMLSGPTHAVWVSEGQARHIHDPGLSGRGLGSGQTFKSYFSQVELHSNDLVVLCGTFPMDWEADLLNERPATSLDASYRKLTFTKGDLHAALIHATRGQGTITIMRPERTPSGRAPESKPVSQDSNAVTSPPESGEIPHASKPEESATEQVRDRVTAPDPLPAHEIGEDELDSLADFAAHLVQPSAYAIPPQAESAAPRPETEREAGPQGFPASIPRAASAPVESEEEAIEQPAISGEEQEPEPKVQGPSPYAQATRQMAKAAAGGIQSGRRLTDRIGASLREFVPRLLPNTASDKPLALPTYLMVVIAIVIPVLVVSIASTVYLQFGQSIQYDELYRQALNARAQAVSEPDPLRQRDAWQSVLNHVARAEEYRQTPESQALWTEAQANHDALMGVVRLEFIPAFASGVGRSAQISRMAASESDLYMLDAEGGNILHASFTGRVLELDTGFNCTPGSYDGYQVGTLVDLLALPKVNSANASVVGIDLSGTLLYCSPGQVPKAIPLPALPNTNWGRINAFALDSGNLYVLDGESRAVWVFVGKDGIFLDTPYFYFGNQVPNIENAIDLAVSGDDLYLLHADGHLTTCTFSRLAEAPTRCVDPAVYRDSFAAHQDLDVFAGANFTQLSLTNPPNQVVLLLDAENQRVFRLSPRSLDLQNQFGAFAGRGNPFKSGPVGAMTVGPNYVLYLAIGDQVYFATNLP